MAIQNIIAGWRRASCALPLSRFDPFRNVRRIDDDDVSADRLELYELQAPDDVDGLQTPSSGAARDRVF
jgi:hypothetical protein